LIFWWLKFCLYFFCLGDDARERVSCSRVGSRRGTNGTRATTL